MKSVKQWYVLKWMVNIAIVIDIVIVILNVVLYNIGILPMGYMFVIVPCVTAIILCCLKVQLLNSKYEVVVKEITGIVKQYLRSKDYSKYSISCNIREEKRYFSVQLKVRGNVEQCDYMECYYLADAYLENIQRKLKKTYVLNINN